VPTSKFAFAIIGSLLFAATPARATDCAPTIAGSNALAAIDGETRLKFLEQRLDAASHAAKIWTGSWGAIYGALTLGSVGLIPLVPHDQRVPYYFSAATSAVGLISLGLSPMRAIPDARWFKSRAHAESVCAAVADGERLLVRDSASEAAGQKALLHIGNLILNFGSLMVIGMVFDRWGSAALQGLAGTLIGEIEIVSTPTVASAALDAYRGGDLTGRPRSSPALSLSVVPLMLTDGGGLAFGARF
jgi:hypothetical protein